MKYFIKIETNKEELSYEIIQKLVGFCFGMLSNSEMENGAATEERKNFWSCEKNKIPEVKDGCGIIPEDISNYKVATDFLVSMEDSPMYSSYKGDIYIRIKEPLYGIYKEIFINRVQNFFDKWIKNNIEPDELLLKSAKLIDVEKGIVLEGYICRNLLYEKPMNIIEACKYIKENPSQRVMEINSNNEYGLNELGEFILIGKYSNEKIELMDIFNSKFLKSYNNNEEQIFFALEEGTLLTNNRARMRISSKSCYKKLEFVVKNVSKINKPKIYCGKKIRQSDDYILLENISIIPNKILLDNINKIPYEMEREMCSLNLGLVGYDTAFKYCRFVVSSPAASSYYPFVCANNTCDEEKMEWLKKHSNFSVRIYDINETYSHGKLYIEREENNCCFDCALDFEKKYDRKKYVIVYIPNNDGINSDLNDIIPYAIENYLDDIQQLYEDEMDIIHDKIGTICEVRDTIL